MIFTQSGVWVMEIFRDYRIDRLHPGSNVSVDHTSLSPKNETHPFPHLSEGVGSEVLSGVDYSTFPQVGAQNVNHHNHDLQVLNSLLN